MRAIVQMQIKARLEGLPTDATGKLPCLFHYKLDFPYKQKLQTFEGG